MGATVLWGTSRNETLASLMRRLGICEERGSGKVVVQVEAYQSSLRSSGDPDNPELAWRDEQDRSATVA